MDQEPKQQAKRLTPLTLVLIIIIVLLVAAGAVLALSKFGGQEELDPAPVSSEGDGTPTIGYEEGVTVVDDPNALQKAYDEMLSDAQEGGIPLEYQNVAFSKDGSKFTCYFANPIDAKYDIFINVYADSEFEKQLYLSGLIPPGKAIREINVEKMLSPGTHTVYVAFTQVEDDHQTMHGQVVVTAEFTVTE